MHVLSNMKLPAKLEYLQDFMDFVSNCARDQGFNQKRINEIELATEEALVNIFNYAYPNNDGDVEIICMSNDERFIIEIRDSGVPFDVLSVKEPDFTSNLSERDIGGFGIFLIRKLIDDVQYRREGDGNILTLVVKKPGHTSLTI